MRISDLVTRLQTLQARYGDLTLVHDRTDISDYGLANLDTQTMEDVGGKGADERGYLRQMRYTHPDEPATHLEVIVTGGYVA